MEGIDNGINKPNGKTEMKETPNSDYWERYEGNIGNKKVLLELPKYFYLERLARDEAFNTLKEYISKAFQYFIDKYSLADSWKLIYNLFWLAYYEMHDYKTPSIAEISKYVNSLELDIHRPDTKELKELFGDLENHNPVLDRYLEKYKIDEQDTAFLTTAFKNSLRNYMTFYPKKKEEKKKGIDENVELLRISPIKHSKNGKYYYAVKISDEDVEKVKVEVLENGEIRISEVMDIWFAYPVRIYKAIYDNNTGKWYYDIQIDKERELLSQNDVVKKLSGKGSGLNEYKIKEALGKILHGMKIEGRYHEIQAKYQAVGVYLNEDETFKLAISMEDGVFPSTSHKAKVYQDLILKKGIPNDEEMKKTFDFILQILTLIDNPIERINTILLYGWGMIAPFHYIFRLKGLMGYYLVNYGVHNTGKTLRAYILNAGYGGMKGPTADSFDTTFRLGAWAEISTFPVLLNDLTKISKKVVSQIKSGAEETEIVERGLPNQSMRIYKSLSSFFITCQDIDWLTSNNEKEALAVMDRFIIGLEETKTKMANLPAIVYEGVRYSGESLKTKAKELPAWAIRIIQDVIEDLNTEDKNTGLKGYPKFEVILSNLIEGIKAKLNEMGILEDLSTRDVEKLAKIYMGIAIFIEEIKRYYPEWQKYEKAKWLFDMQDLTKFVYFLAKNWLGAISLYDTLEQYILDIHEAYNYWYALKHDQYTKNRDLLSRTGYNFRNDIIIDDDNKTIFLTQSYIKIAKNKFSKKGYGAYNTLSSLAKDLAKALGKDYKEIYKVMPYELNGVRPRVIVLSIDDILNYLSSGEGGEN